MYFINIWKRLCHIYLCITMITANAVGRSYCSYMSTSPRGFEYLLVLEHNRSYYRGRRGHLKIMGISPKKEPAGVILVSFDHFASSDFNIWLRSYRDVTQNMRTNVGIRSQHIRVKLSFRLCFQTLYNINIEIQGDINLFSVKGVCIRILPAWKLSCLRRNNIKDTRQF